MSVYIFDDVLPAGDAKKVENLVKGRSYSPTGRGATRGTNYYPFELPKGLKWGDWEPQKGPNRHWVTSHGQNQKSLEKLGMLWVHELWCGIHDLLNLQKDFGIEEYGDAYINVHSHGQEPHIHTDDSMGNMTVLYYPILNWDQWHWGGGTTIWEPDIDNTVDRIEELEVLEHATYKGNRVVLFDAYHWHRAEPVARICHDMRYSVTYKTIANGGNNERLDFYA